MFIDNLPKDENSIRVLLKEVNKHMKEFEKYEPSAFQCLPPRTSKINAV